MTHNESIQHLEKIDSSTRDLRGVSDVIGSFVQWLSVVMDCFKVLNLNQSGKLTAKNG